MQVISQESQDYPVLLKQLSDAPEKLYIKGDFTPEIFQHCLAVVGSRKMTEYGKRVTNFLVRKLASLRITIVSGFMYGIDAEAHKSALSAGGKTIAVMPCGIDVICPDSQKGLYAEILENGGLIMSEYPNDTEPKVWTFPRRNRIVAGLCQATLVVEAGEKSGSLITASLAWKFGRKVFTVPGDIFSPYIKGNWQLLLNGASLAISGCEIEEFYSRIIGDDPSANYPSKVCNISTQEKTILDILSQDKLSINQLNKKLNSVTQISFPELLNLLISLQMRNVIQQEGEKYYVG